MIENLTHIQPSQQLKHDFWEYIDRESRSSIHSSSDFDPELEIKDDTYNTNETQIFYVFPKDVKRKNIKINCHKPKNDKLNCKYPTNLYHQRNDSNESMPSSSPETPHQSNDTDKQKYEKFFQKKPIMPINTSNESNTSNKSNLTTILMNIKIFDLSNKLQQVSQESQDVWINIKPNDTSTDVINEVINHDHINNITLYGTKSEQYQLFYYDDDDEEIRDYLGALKRYEIVASKGVDVIAMKYNMEYCEYKINNDSECILVIEHDRISIKTHFSYLFDLDAMADTDHIDEYRWVNKEILLIENKEQKIDKDDNKLTIELCSNVFVLDSNKSMFEINFVLNCQKEKKCMEKISDDHILHSLSSSIDEFVDIGSYKPENYDQLWNPKEIIPKLNEYYSDCYAVRYSTKSVKECVEIVKKIKHLISSDWIGN